MKVEGSLNKRQNKKIKEPTYKLIRSKRENKDTSIRLQFPKCKN